MDRYSIGVTGQLRRGFERTEVQLRLAALFKCPPEQALRLISGKPVTLKSGLDRETAARYQQQLLQVGVEPEIKTMAALAAPLSAKGGAVPPSAVPARPESVRPAARPLPGAGALMDCPKCGVSQPRAEICAKCGIILAKYQKGCSAAQEPQVVAAAPSELEELGHFVEHNFSAYRHKFQDLLQQDGKYVFHWHWPGFFIPLPWLLFRKMYLHAIILLVLVLLPIPFLGLVWSLVFGASGNYLYFRHCRKKIAAVAATGPARPRAIALAGGTMSLPLTILSTLLLGVFIVFVNYKIFSMANPGKFGRHDQSTAAPLKDQAAQATHAKMVVLGQVLQLSIAAEKFTGKQIPPPESMGDIQRRLKLDAKGASDEWGSELRFFKTEEGKTMLLSAGPDREFETEDDLSHEVKM